MRASPASSVSQVPGSREPHACRPRVLCLSGAGVTDTHTVVAL